MSPLARFQHRVKAAYAAFRNPRAAKSWGYSNFSYGGTDLSSNSQAMWSKWGAAAAVLVNHAMYACVTTRAESVVKLKHRIVDKETRKPVPNQDSDPLMRAIAAFQRHYGSPLWQEWMYDRDIMGEVYIEPLYDEYTGRVMALDLLSALNVTPQSNDGAKIDYFQYQYGFRTVNIPTERLVYDRNTIGRMTSIHGYSPVLAAIGSKNAGVMQAAGQAMLAYFNNDGTPQTTIMPPTPEGRFSAEDVEKIRRLAVPVKSASGKYSMWIMPHNVGFFQAEQPDLRRWSELLDAEENRTFSVFRVPPEIAGATKSTGYQTSPERTRVYDGTIAAVADDLAQFINHEIAPTVYEEMEPTRELEFETGDLNHIDAEERQAAKEAYEAGSITFNEYRAAIGWEEIEGGDVYRKPAGVEFVTREQLFAPKPDVITPREAITVTSQPPRPEMPAPQDPPQLPANVPMRAVDELDQYKQRVINGRAHKSFEFTVIDADTGAQILADVRAHDDIADQRAALAAWRVKLREMEVAHA